MFDGIRIQPVSWLKAGFYACVIGLIYYSAFNWLVFHDWAREDYSHCALIPFVVLYIIWEKRQALSSLPSIPSWTGLIPLAFGIVLFWLGELGGEFFVMYISFWLVIVGICWLHLGWEKIRAIWFALFIMLAMFPFPNFVNVRISLYLKLISSKIGVWMLQLYGMSAYREGNIIDLGFTKLQVVDACSGLRYLFPLMGLGLILAYWFKASLWKKAVLFLSSIPIAIAVNSFRIALTGVLYSFWGAKVAEGFFHGFSGWLIFIFSLAILGGYLVILKAGVRVQGLGAKVEGLGFRVKGLGVRGEKREEGIGSRVKGQGEEGKGFKDSGVQGFEREKQGSGAGDQGAGAKEEGIGSRVKGLGEKPVISDQLSVIRNQEPETLHPSPVTRHNSQFTRLSGKGSLAQFLVAVVILGVTLGLSYGVEFRHKVPISRPFSQFPIQVGEWSGTTEVMEQKFIDRLDLSDYIIFNYQNRQGRMINFYVAYYQDQRKGESIHSPDTCLPGSGWEFREAGDVKVPLGDGRASMTVNRAFMEKSGQRELTYYWFPKQGRVLTKLYQLKLYTFWDSLTKQRTDAALVRVITAVYPDEKLEDAEARLQGFTREIVPVLGEFIPK